MGVGLVLYSARRSAQTHAVLTSTGSPRPRRRSRYRPIQLAAAGVVLVVAMGGALYLLLSALAAQEAQNPDSQAFAEPTVTPQAVMTAISTLLATPGPVGGATHTGDAQGPTNPQDYLQDALSFIQSRSIMNIDWNAWQAKVLAEAGRPLTRADTHFALSDALQMLGDNHSQLETPDVYLGTEQRLLQSLTMIPPYPERYVRLQGGWPFPYLNPKIYSAGVHDGDLIEAIDGQPTASMGASTFYRDLYSGSYVGLTLRRESMPAPIDLSIDHPYVSTYYIPEGRRLDGNIGYIRLPGNGNGLLVHQYAEIVQEIIRELDQTPACGWVIDLQNNNGGQFYPMIAGIGPVLGEGQAGEFISKRNSHWIWTYFVDNGSNGKVGNVRVGSTIAQSVNAPYLYQLKRPMPPVAVLTDRWTASAGEALLISFRGRPNTRTFGEPTYGLPTYNTGKVLSDWAELIVTAYKDADRTGKIYGYNERIQPDQFVPSGSPDQQGTDADPVLAAGASWLRSQPACAR